MFKFVRDTTELFHRKLLRYKVGVKVNIREWMNMSKSNLAEKETRIFSEELCQIGVAQELNARQKKVQRIKSEVQAGTYQPQMLSVAAVLERRLFS